MALAVELEAVLKVMLGERTGVGRAASGIVGAGDGEGRMTICGLGGALTGDGRGANLASGLVRTLLVVLKRILPCSCVSG